MSATVHIIGAASGIVLPLLSAFTHVGAVIGRREADVQHAAYTNRLERRREAARERTRRPGWPPTYEPLLPATVPARPLPSATAPLTAVRPGPPGSGRHRKG